MKKWVRSRPILAAFVSVLMIPIGLINSGSPRLLNTTVTGKDSGIVVDGEIEYVRGGPINGFWCDQQSILSGTAQFHTSTGNTYSSQEVLNDLIAGKVKHGPLRWHLNYVALIMAMFNSWIIIWFILWLFRKKTGEIELKSNGEQLMDVNRP